MNVNAVNRKAVEGYLREYAKMKEDIRRMEEEIASSGMVSSAGLKNKYAVPDMTAKKALFSASLYELNYMRRVVSAIDLSYARMKERQKVIFEEYFVKGGHYLNVCAKLNIEKSMFYNCVREIVGMVAEELKMPV